MSENYGYSQEEWKLLNEFGKLSNEMDEAETRIEQGIDTSAEQLDGFLAATTAFYQWKAHNPHPDHPPSEREESGEIYLKYQRIYNGTYQKEKANYALEEAQKNKRNAEKKEEYAQKDNPNYNESLAYQRLENLKVSANWLRTAANCLTMPEARPPAAKQEGNNT